jgi:hypothetical protein
MNAKTKKAARSTRNQQSTAAPAPIAQKLVEKTEPIEEQNCLNLKCKALITERNKYGHHPNGWSCCKACEDIINPRSAEFRRQRSGHFTPSISGIDERTRPNQVEADF